MRFPLFALMRGLSEGGARQCPEEIRHSKILCVRYLQEKMPRYFASYVVGVFGGGHEVIDAMVIRLLKGRMPAVGSTVARLRRKIVNRVYAHGAQVSRYLRDEVIPLERMCRPMSEREDMSTLFYVDGKRLRQSYWISGHWSPDLRITEDKGVPCAWCGSRVYPKLSWRVKYRWRSGLYHCNSFDCRKMHHLSDIPQSRGGIDLTPSQRKALDFEAWDGQRALNYLALVAKEIKRGSRANNDVR